MEEQLAKVSIQSQKISTGIIFDRELQLHAAENEKSHPESPARLKAIIHNLQRQKLLSKENCEIIDKIEPVDQQIIALVHRQSYLQYVEQLWPKNGSKKSLWYNDCFYNQYTNYCANLAVGGVIMAIDKVFQNQWDRAFAIVRPPGHHSGHHERINGFCVFNNIAIGAKYAQVKYNVDRVIILDWDVHHGDGTQNLFYEDSSVLFCSLHRYDNGFFYPGQKGAPQNTGQNQGLGFSVNIAWNIENAKKMTIGDQEYIYAFERILLPIFLEFNPDLILISAGFDSAKGDPIGGLEVQDAYGYIIERILSKFNVKLVVALEGGYSIHACAINAERTLRSLLNEKLPNQTSSSQKSIEEFYKSCTPNKLGLQAVQKVIEIQEDFWQGLSNPDILEFENQVIENVLIANQNQETAIIGNRAFKKKDEQEYSFYSEFKLDQQTPLLSPLRQQLKENWDILRQILPKFFGICRYNKQEYIKLENILYDKNFSSFLCLKLKQQNENILYYVKSANFKSKEGISKEIWEKDESRVFEVHEFKQILSRLFLSNDVKNIKAYCVSRFIKSLEIIKEMFDYSKAREYLQTCSIIFIVDNKNYKYYLKLIDFKSSAEEVPITLELLQLGISNIIDICREFDK